MTTRQPDPIARPERDPLKPPIAFGWGVRLQTDHVDAVATMLLRRFLLGLRNGEASLEDIVGIEVLHMPSCSSHDERNGACNCPRALALLKPEMQA